MLCCVILTFYTVVGSIESGLFTQILEAQAAAFGDSWEQLKKMESAFEHAFIFYDGFLYRKQSGNEVNLVIPEDVGLWTDLLWQFHDGPCGGCPGIYHMVGALSK